MNIKLSISNNKFGKWLPAEDSVAFKNMVFCVADGITRDPKLPPKFKGKKIEDALKYYPNPSGAKKVADIFCNDFVTLAKELKNIKAIFTEINSSIANYNNKKIELVDYLTDDYFACVACGGYIKNNILYYGYIGDCGLAIFNKDGKLKFQTKNGLADFINFENKYLRKKDFNWVMPEYRHLIRSEYRNKKKTHKNKLISYGALTGEKGAISFINQGKKKLNTGDLVVAYSDGFENIINCPDFFKTIYNKSENNAKKNLVELSNKLASKDYDKFGHERSLVAFII